MGSSRFSKLHRVLAFLIALACACFALSSCSRGDEGAVVVYAYDSFVSEWGPGPGAVKGFKEKTGIDIRLVPKGDAGQVLAAAVLEKKRPEADVLVGLDGNLLGQARAEGVLAPYEAKGLSAVPERLRFTENLLTPYDYGSFAFIWDSESGVEPPKDLSELASPRFERKIILMDPRTSSPGLGFLSWIISVYGEGWKDYWSSIRPSVLTIAPGWDSGYGLFTKGEAPLVLSYTTSPAYHLYADDEDRYVALSFPEGHPVQVEGAGLVRGSKRSAKAKKFLDYLLSDDFQGKVALTNWMLPVSPAVKLPECYSVVPDVRERPSVPGEVLAKALDEWPDVASR